MKLTYFVACALLVSVVSAWSYPEPTNPGDADNGWTGTCATGQAQSPINIVRDQTKCVREGEAEGVKHKINFHYWAKDGLEVANNGHTIKMKSHVGFVTTGGCSPCTGQRYHLKQVHFRSPAEHTIDAAVNKSGRYPLELHLVHQKEGATGLNDLLFVSVWFYQQQDGGFPNSFLSALDFGHLPTTAGAVNKLAGTVNIGASLNEALSGEYYTYHGSLTTPTCEETVKWYIMKTPLGATKEQLAAITAVLNPSNTTGNARSVKPLNNRHVYWYRKRH